MPYVSDAQRRFFHSSGAARAGISSATVSEFDSASKGMKLPERARDRGKRLAVASYSRKHSASAASRSAQASSAARSPSPNPHAPLGQGGRFAALKAKLAARPGVDNPGALAASIGRKKYGKGQMAAMATQGRT